MRLLVSPISGGSFPIQMSMMRDLTRCSYFHDVYMCTSGGAVSTFALVASNYSEIGLHRILSTLDERYIFRHWSYLPLVPSWLAGFGRGTAFNISPYCVENLSTFATSSMLLQAEVWIGTASISSGFATVFCTKSKGSTIVRPDEFGYEVKYLDGDVEKTIKATLSSATIPMLMPETTIDGKSYVDGGLRASSPLTLLADSLPDGPLHLDYLSPSDAELPIYDESCRFDNLTTKTIKTLQETTRTMSLVDRRKAITLVKGNPNSEPDLAGECDRETLVHILSSRGAYYRSCLELYDNKSEPVPLLSLTSAKVRRLLESCTNSYQFRLWVS